MFRIFFDDNSTSHNDITLLYGEQQFVCDSYYLALEKRDGDHATRTRTILREMLERWEVALDQSESYWLVGLQDQATWWLQCVVTDSEVTLTPGWSSLEGHAVDPATVSLDPPLGFEPLMEIAAVTLSRDEVAEGISRSLKMLAAQDHPQTDPTVIFEHFRGAYGTQLLTAATAHFDLFTKIHQGQTDSDALRSSLELEPRPFCVLMTAMKAMGFVHENGGKFSLTPLAAEHLLTSERFDVTNYIGLAAGSPDVANMVERLRTNTPAGLDANEDGTAFIYRNGVPSAMEQSDLARHFTMSLAGRAKNVAPVLADRYRLHDANVLLDVGGGSGIYAIAYLARNPNLRAIVLDRPEVLEVAKEFAVQFGVDDRLELLPGDMFADAFPEADVMLLSNILHDWDVPECQTLVSKCADALTSDGRLLIHDVFLNDDHDGPLPIALYSASLYSFTEGRAYSRAEYREWMQQAGLRFDGDVETLVHCGVLIGRK